MLQLLERAQSGAASLFVLAVLSWVAPAALASQAPSRIPVSVVEGRLVVRCDVSTRFRRIPVNLFIDYEETCGLQLHNQVAVGLKSETDDGRSFPITVHLPGLDLEVERREIGDDEYFDEFTKWNSIALGEVAAVGTLGAKLLANYHILFDLDAGFLELSAPRPRDEGTGRENSAQDEVGPGLVRVPLTDIGGIAWLPVSFDGGQPAAMALGTGRYDTTVDHFLAGDLGAPAGDIGPVTLGEFDLTEFVVLRPEEVNYVHPDGALGVTGLNVLESFRVEVDRVNKWATFESMHAPSVPAGDAEFFAAMVDEDQARIAAFIENYEEHRLRLEAARLLVTLLLVEGADIETMRPAMVAVDQACPEDLRATSALAQMKICNAFGVPEHIILAGEIGLESGRDDRYPDAVHKLHARLGEVHLTQKNEDKAWRHLLSAAFGLPEDGMINLNLGKFYEGQGRHKRAFSRYLQASLSQTSGPEAIEGMERVAPLLPDGEGFSVDVVERMVAGKVRNFGASSKFEATEDNTSNRVCLVEFFTNSFLGSGVRGAIAGALANEGLTSHFPLENVAFLSYHLPSGRLDPLINELAEDTAALLGVPGPWVHVIDGVDNATGAGTWSDAEKIYNEIRDLVTARLDGPSKFEMELEGSVEGGVCKGTLVVRGNARRKTRVQIILAEKGVLFPGSTEVFVHRFLARAALTGSTDGIEWDPDDEDKMEIPFEVSLEDIRAENEAYLDELCESTGGVVRKLSMSIDPAQVRFVGTVRDSRSGRVLQAIAVEPTNLAELEEAGR